jgi:hypothetical protein
MNVVEDAGADPRLGPILRELERRLSAVPELTQLTVPAVIEPSFDQRSGDQYIRESPALYHRREKKILVNASLFWATPPDIQLAVLAHETAHALFDSQNAKLDPECLEADIAACRWGFREPLARDREPRYGREYAEALRRVGPEAEDEVRRLLRAALDARRDSRLWSWATERR